MPVLKSVLTSPTLSLKDRALRLIFGLVGREHLPTPEFVLPVASKPAYQESSKNTLRLTEPSQPSKTRRNSPVYFAALWKSNGPVAIEHCVEVKAFATVGKRDAWVTRAWGSGNFYHPNIDSSLHLSREALTRKEAARYMKQILIGSVGGIQGGHSALRELGVSEHD